MVRRYKACEAALRFMKDDPAAIDYLLAKWEMEVPLTSEEFQRLCDLAKKLKEENCNDGV